jgi:ABC-type amino acid transport substrate-binding protein
MHTYAIPNGGVIYVENNAWVEGSINGQRVTVVAANLIGGASPDIYLGMNNLTYTNFNGNDIIGLVAQNNISVVENSQNYLTIDGALLAQNGRVGRNWYSSMYNKNTITVNGSIATNQRYGFAYTDGTGYANRILNFDNNLIYYPPPYFPTGTEYAIDLWQEL